MRWAAIDFETATHERASACAVGVVVVDGGEVRYRQSWLIRPPGNRYHPRNVAIHGIRPVDTEHAPEFRQVWNEVEYVVGDRPLAAHNAGFDASVLTACADMSGAEVRPRPIWCSMQLARRAWPDLGRWNLPTVAQHVGVDLEHHDALSDANACAAVIGACVTAATAQGLRAAGDLLGITPRQLGPASPGLTPATS